MAAFHSQVKPLAILAFLKPDPKINQLSDSIRPLGSNNPDNFFVAQAITRAEGVANMGVYRVFHGKHGRYASLGQVGCRVSFFLFRDQGDLGKLSDLERKR
jgi:hypothetical protein